MALQPMGDVTPQPEHGDAAAEPQRSFRERKMQSLQDEPQPHPGRREEPAESDDDLDTGYPDDQPEELDASDAESDAQGALSELPPDEDDDAASQDDAEELSYDDLQGKYKSLMTEFSRVTANRKKIEQDYSDGIAENITYRHQLEDLNQQAALRAKLFLDLANNQVSKLENIDWQSVPPEKMQEARQRYNKAVADRNQLMQVFEAQSKEAHDALEVIKKREAEIARNVLTRRIPQWSDEHYGTLREHAQRIGYSVNEYNDLTDWRIIELIHRDWERDQAVEKVQKVKRKRQARVPRNRNGRPQPRSADGRYRQSREEAFDKPGDKLSFREMKMRQMERERKAGR